MKHQRAGITSPKSISRWVDGARIQTQSPSSFFNNKLPPPVAPRMQGWAEHGFELVWFLPSSLGPSEKAGRTTRTRWRMMGSELWRCSQLIIINELSASALKRQPLLLQSNWRDRGFPLPVATHGVCITSKAFRVYFCSKPIEQLSYCVMCFCNNRSVWSGTRWPRSRSECLPNDSYLLTRFLPLLKQKADLTGEWRWADGGGVFPGLRATAPHCSQRGHRVGVGSWRDLRLTLAGWRTWPLSCPSDKEWRMEEHP